MGLFSKKKVENAVQINDVTHNPIMLGWGWDYLNPKKKGFKPFGQIYLNMCLNQLYSGISNVSFETCGQNKNSIVARGICDFVDSNATLLMNQMLWSGYMCVFYGGNNEYWLPKQNEIRTDQYGAVINHNAVVLYSPLYQTKRKSLMLLVKPLLDMLDTLANTMSESCGTMGVLPIISGNSIPANPQFKQDLAEMMSKEYGWGEDQLKYFLSQQELKVDKIDLQIKDLELRDNILSQFKALLNYFEVPIDLVIGNTTYDNMASARLYFYENTIRKYAECLLKISRSLLTASPEFIPQSTINYRITNVAGLDKTISERCSERTAYIDTLIKLREAGVDVDDELEKVFSDLKQDYKEV